MTVGLFPGELTPDTTVGGCIDIFENVWPNPLETIALIEQECMNPNSGVHFNRASTIGRGVFQNERTNSDMGITHLAQMTGSKVLKDVHNQMYFLMLAGLLPYAKRYGLEEPLVHEHYNLLRYQEGQEYKSHYDGFTGLGRAISAIIYLNNDYEGGEIEFPHHKVKIKPEPGMMILFPSNFAYKHIAHPVKSGTKYALVTWIHDRPLD